MKPKLEFWTVYGDTVCSKHRTTTAAVRAAVKCEGRGGVVHRILKVYDITYLRDVFSEKKR